MYLAYKNNIITFREYYDVYKTEYIEFINLWNIYYEHLKNRFKTLFLSSYIWKLNLYKDLVGIPIGNIPRRTRCIETDIMDGLYISIFTNIGTEILRAVISNRLHFDHVMIEMNEIKKKQNLYESKKPILTMMWKTNTSLEGL